MFSELTWMEVKIQFMNLRNTLLLYFNGITKHVCLCGRWYTFTMLYLDMKEIPKSSNINLTPSFIIQKLSFLINAKDICWNFFLTLTQDFKCGVPKARTHLEKSKKAKYLYAVYYLILIIYISQYLSEIVN
jgi:hypothetical protein